MNNLQVVQEIRRHVLGEIKSRGLSQFFSVSEPRDRLITYAKDLTKPNNEGTTQLIETTYNDKYELDGDELVERLPDLLKRAEQNFLNYIISGHKEFFKPEEFSAIKQVASKVYAVNSPVIANYNSVEDKLKFLLQTFVFPEFGTEGFKICREEKFNRQAGRGASHNNFSDYILLGIAPSSAFLGKSLFIKIYFHSLSSDSQGLSIEIDTDRHSKTDRAPDNVTNYVASIKNSFNLELPKLLNLNYYSLAELIAPDIRRSLEEYMQAYNYYISQNKSIGNSSMNNSHENRNYILYGPPGTGKTYTTINAAVQFASPKNYVEDDRELNKAEYNKLLAAKQIVFTTFHQSMSYEDFVEGIKPRVKGDQIFYEIKSGIFRKIVKDARESYESIGTKEPSFEQAFEHLKNEWLESENSYLEIPMKQKAFKITNITERHIAFEKASGGTSHDLVISTLKDIYLKKRDFDKAGLGVYYHPLVEKLRSYDIIKETKELKNYVLIIDEINRGNIASIFGELITLLEKDKRLGEPNEIRLELPYSRSEELFSVPPNLYIIGTMNTADRSVEALDTALRRRFNFIPMYPRPELLTPLEMLRRFWDSHIDEYYGSVAAYDKYERNIRDLLGLILVPGKEKEYVAYGDNNKNDFSKTVFEATVGPLVQVSKDGVNLFLLLDTLNQRILQLKDIDHQIGHSYFMNVFSVSDLQEVFYNKVIPLLQEYFYGDFGKIGLVLGKAFVEKITTHRPFAEFPDYDSDLVADLLERPVYKITDKDSWTIAVFRSIYNE